MNFQELAKQLRLFEGAQFYFYCPLMDFTKSEPAYVQVYGKNRNVKIPLAPANLPIIKSLLKACIFKQGVVVVSWDIKNLYSYVMHHSEEILQNEEIPLEWTHNSETMRERNMTDEEASNLNKTPQVSGPIILDLKVIESYSGISQEAPQSLKEALKRLKKAHTPEALEIYKKVHLPLITEVIPKLETVGVIYGKKKVYANYQIEGQINGRLKCSGVFKKSYNPHTISDHDKTLIKPACYDCGFIYLDYQALEVCVLQWLSKDENLGRMFDSGDVYINMWQEVTGRDENHDDARNFMKSLFLPVVFGAGSKTIAKSLSISEEMAKKLINRLHDVFSTAFSYLENQKALVNDETAIDHFGRKRIIQSGKEYQALNFCVQSPAATICLSKLIELHNTLKNLKLGQLGFYVHDGYVIFANKSEIKKIVPNVVKTLESESLLAPGLKLKVSCSMGSSLDNMRLLKRKD